MKKAMIGLLALTAAITCLLGILGLSLMKSTYGIQLMRVETIAGAVLSKYPQAEDAFVEAAEDQTYSMSAEGARILSSYGYDDEMALEQSYQRTSHIYLAILAMFLISVSACGAIAFRAMEYRKHRQEEVLLGILEDCVAENYRFISDEHRLDGLDNEFFAETLLKLGENLALKTERFNQEQDHTKTLVTDISHQLKTPISAMKACFDMYLEADREEEREEFLKRCRMQMEQLETLAEVLVNVSRLENGMISFRQEETTLQKILLDAVNVIYHKASARNIDIITSDFEDIPLQLDRKWTSEAIANILDNAVKYSPPGSDIHIVITKLFSFVRIEIEDRGIGISKKEQNLIFRRFYRGKSPMVRNTEGSGVGLYLCRHILEEQGGTVHVKAAPHRGSIFVVQLPLMDDLKNIEAY